jgi:ATP-binding cassette, subfamily B, bacterial
VSPHTEVARTETNFDVRSALLNHQRRLAGMWALLKGYHAHYVGAAMALAMSAALNTAGLLLLRYLVDDVIVGADRAMVGSLILVAVWFVLLAVMRGAFSFWGGSLSSQAAEGIALRIRDYMFDHLQHLTFTYHGKTQTGELIQRSTSDIDAVRRFFADQAVGIARIVLLFIINFGALLLIHAGLALISVIVVPIILIISIFFFQYVSKAYEAFQTQEARLSNVLQENLSGVRVVRAFARQSYERDKFGTENLEHFRLGVRFEMLHASYWPITDLLTGLQMLFGFFVGAMLVIDGGITLGVYVAYVGMLGWIINPMRDLGRLLVEVSTGFVSYDRIAEVMREEWEHLGKNAVAPVEQLQGSVRFEGVSFGYDVKRPVLQDISFQVQAGQTVAILGSTGSGKSSLVSLLTRFYEHSGGQIYLDDIDLRDYPKRFLRANIGVVEQEPFLFSRTIRENITYGVPHDVSDEDVEAAARAAAVHEVIMAFPKGYNTLVGERGVTVSGGQKQRIALARTLLKNPRVLILDDATSSVDTQTEAEIREALRRLMEQRTSFIIAHRIQSVMTADFIVVMDKGRIVQRGTHEELMLVDGIYRQTYEMQARIENDLERELSDVGL